MKVRPPTSGFYPLGFRVGAGHVGIKKSAKLLDMAAVVSDRDCAAAGVFTSNVFKAAPVQLDQRILAAAPRGVRAVIINSGNANAVTGRQGLADAEAMVAAAAAAAGSADAAHGALVMSTGVIGQPLPRDKVAAGVPRIVGAAAAGHDAWLEGARGIMTTDTFPKLLSREFTAGGQTYRLAGIAKGAGMIAPNMATLLGVLATDAPAAPPALQAALRAAVDASFNSISIDGDMSTNDTILALANGAAGGAAIETPDSPGYAELAEAMADVARELAQLVVRDGEGATKFVELSVTGAESVAAARRVAETISRSLLVKTALYGKDANWGRILCAVGYAGVAVDPAATSVTFVPGDGSAELPVLVRGEPQNVDEARASEILALENVGISIELGAGSASTKFWTCDLSHEYVTINGDYRS